MSKHAYLIIAHKNDMTFYTLLKMLDNIRNDIFVHMDLKNKSYNPKKVEKLMKYSKLYHVKRTNITWGGWSQINAELLLLHRSIEVDKYAYYHLLSGEDLPIKSQDEIHSFFEERKGREFIRFEKTEFDYRDRIQYYYYFQEKLGRNKNFKIWKICNKISLETQKILHFDRSKDIEFQKGTNWFSITDELAHYVCEQINWIEKIFKYTICCDEVFLQTLVHNSKFRDQLYHEEYDNSPNAIVRLIDWSRGNPYVFKKEDFEEIKASKMLWARKFDCMVDSEIISLIQREFI